MKAIDRIRLKENDVRYKKVGRKYVPCGDYFALEGLGEGYWLIKVTPSFKSIKACVYPDRAEQEAAMHDSEEKIEEIIRKASEARPKTIPLTLQQKADWDWLIARHPNVFNTLEYPSIYENAQLIMKAILNK